MRGMQQEEAILSRWRFLELCVAGIAGLSLLSLGGCGGSEDSSGGENDNGDRKKDEKDGDGGGSVAATEVSGGRYLKKGGAARAAPTRVRNPRHTAWIALLALLPLPAGVLSLLAPASTTAAA